MDPFKQRTNLEAPHSNPPPSPPPEKEAKLKGRTVTVITAEKITDTLSSVSTKTGKASLHEIASVIETFIKKSPIQDLQKIDTSVHSQLDALKTKQKTWKKRSFLIRLFLPLRKLKKVIQELSTLAKKVDTAKQASLKASLDSMSGANKKAKSYLTQALKGGIKPDSLNEFIEAYKSDPDRLAMMDYALGEAKSDLQQHYRARLETIEEIKKENLAFLEKKNSKETVNAAGKICFQAKLSPDNQNVIDLLKLEIENEPPQEP